MSVSLVLVALMAVMYAVGVYLLLERSITRVLLGFLLVGNATNLLILVVSGRAGVAPFFGEEPATQLADPLPQAFVLTSIVITFGVSAFLMALIYRSWRLAHADVVQDDIDDVEIGRLEVSVAEDLADAIADDTEFGTRATAAVSTALDLEELERLEELHAAELREAHAKAAQEKHGRAKERRETGEGKES